MPEQKQTSWRAWVAGVLGALVLIVAVQNSQTTHVNVLFINVTAPLIVVILASAGIGAVVGYVAPLVRSRRRQHSG